jgi:hypothetical protein
MYQKKKSRIKSKKISDLQPCQGHFHQYQRVAMLTVVIIDHHLKKFCDWGEKSLAHLACELSTQIGREPARRSFQLVQPRIEGQIRWKTRLFEKNRTKIVSHVHSQTWQDLKNSEAFSVKTVSSMLWGLDICLSFVGRGHHYAWDLLVKRERVVLTLGLRRRRVSRWKNQLLRRPSPEGFVLATTFIMKHWQDVFM